jgi:ubiquinone biosynthesis accessory factor UbiJ
MTIRDIAFEGLQFAINGLLDLDEKARGHLAGLHGRCIAIELTGIGVTLHFVPGHDGRLQVLGETGQDPDCRLSGSPIDLLRASDRESGSDQLFAGRVRIDGDSGIAQRFSEALGGLDIDWEEQLSRLVGDVAAHEIGRRARAAQREAARVGRASSANLADYLTEEARLLPHRFEVEAWMDEVDRLRDDVDRLAARLDLLAEPGR